VSNVFNADHIYRRKSFLDDEPGDMLSFLSPSHSCHGHACENDASPPPLSFQQKSLFLDEDKRVGGGGEGNGF